MTRSSLTNFATVNPRTVGAPAVSIVSDWVRLTAQFRQASDNSDILPIVPKKAPTVDGTGAFGVVNCGWLEACKLIRGAGARRIRIGARHYQMEPMMRRDVASLGQRAIFAIAIVLLSSGVAYGATYYVRTDGNNANDGSSNTPGSAWQTITWAATHVGAGDVVRVQAGTYSERVAPGVSGTVGNPVTFVADGNVTFCGMDISSKNYLRIIGFTMDTAAGTCTKSNRAVDVGGTNTGLEFWNNTFRNANYAGIASGSYADRHHNFIVIGNKFTAIGGNGGNGSAMSLRGNNNIIAYNEVTAVDPDAFQVDGTFNRWLNNYIHNVLDTYDLHSDVFQSNSSSLGLSYNLFEANFEVGAGTLANEHGALLQNQSTSSCSTGSCGVVTENLFRRNVWYNTSGGILGVNEPRVGGITNTREVHDTVVSVMRTQPMQTYGVSFSGTGVNAYLYNNVEYQAWGANATSGIQAFLADSGATITGADYNLAFTPDLTPLYATPWTAQAHPRSNVDPSFVDYANQDFTLGVGSGARGMGGPLTTVAGNGTGTIFTVVTGGGGFFRGPNPSVRQYGGNLTAGDVITVGNTTLSVVSVSGDSITVTQPFNWANGDPVYLGATAMPDLGAYPSRIGSYGLTSTYSVLNGTVTVTPSDPGLVRFVVCYEDGVPTTVDNSSPYTCSIGTGSLDVRVYPLFASKTLFTPAAPAVLPPTNLRIIKGELAQAFEHQSVATGPLFRTLSFDSRSR